MRTYGPEFVRRWGTADNWPVDAQLVAAARAHASGRGFTPVAEHRPRLRPALASAARRNSPVRGR